MTRTPTERWLACGPSTPEVVDPFVALQKTTTTMHEASKVIREATAVLRVLEAQKITLVTALEAVTKELKGVVKDEQCDHSVGICWCETFRAIELADEALKQAKE